MQHLGDLTNPKLAALYASVPRPKLEEFQAFCQAYPYQRISTAGVEWPYLDTQGGGDALLLLSGALAIPDLSWTTIAHFAGRYRVIAPAYPAVKTMDALVDGIAEILHRAGIDQAHVIGGSYGGFVAQVFVRRCSELARSLVLSHTGPPDPASGEKIRRAMGWMSWLPQGALRWLMGKRLGSM
jgi:pimeloyl-ACP methyl ester carboxylesterase